MTDIVTARATVLDAREPTDVIALNQSPTIRQRIPKRLKRRTCLLLTLAGSLAILPLDLAVAPGQGPESATAKPVEALFVPGEHVALALQSQSPSHLFGLEDIRRHLDTMMRNVARHIELPSNSDVLDSLTEDEQQSVEVGGRALPRDLVNLILLAAHATHTDPAYLMALADKESSFDPTARAPTSSAEGMFQFIDKTWLAVVQQHGPSHGLASEARAISSVGDDLVVTDEKMRERIMDLRREPYLAAVLAAEMMKRDRAEVGFRIGRDLELPELYLTHFLGQEQAGRLLELVRSDPDKSAAAEFPAAAKANRSIFTTKEPTIAGKGKARRRVMKERPATIAEVYERLGRMMQTRLARYGRVMALVGAQTATGS